MAKQKYIKVGDKVNKYVIKREYFMGKYKMFSMKIKGTKNSTMTYGAKAFKQVFKEII